MVIRKGCEWGESGHPSADVPVAADDVHASQLIEEGIREFVISSGDMARTIGSAKPRAGSSYRRLPIDLIEIAYLTAKGHTDRVHAFSNARLERTWLAGGFLRGEVVVLCNAQYLCTLDIAPRGHPNDGKIELLHFARSLSIRQRIQILGRSRTGTHLPHPGIDVRRITETADVPGRGRLIVDGRYVGSGRIASVRCIPDALTVWSAGPSEASTSSAAVA